MNDELEVEGHVERVHDLVSERANGLHHPGRATGSQCLVREPSVAKCRNIAYRDLPRRIRNIRAVEFR
jgi:hypothetical protein